MASFAKLTTDWNENERSYLDNFIDFILGAMADRGLQQATPDEMSKAVEEVYGLRFPVAVTLQIARRAKRRGQLENIGNAQFVPSREALDQAILHTSTVQNFEREQVKLGKLFSEWKQEEVGGEDIAEERVLPLILDYVETYYGSLMSSHSGRGTIREGARAVPTDETRLVAAFITYISEGEPEAFDYVLNIAKGSMLSASLFTSGSPLEARPFRDTILMLDTRIILRLLGYEGELAHAAAVDYLQLAASQGAELGCFEFTIGEIRSILFSADTSARTGDLWAWKPGTVGSYFWNRDLGSGDIVLAIGRLRDDIESAGISILGSPRYDDPRYVVDEEAVEGAIKSISANYSDRALKHDVQALSAIVRMRAGRSKDSLEECRAVFVTTNSFILRASRRVQDMKMEPWFVSILDTDLASLTWIKTPLDSPDLPRGSLVATCLSVLSPSDEMWAKYVRELERRHTAGEISDAELLLARRVTEEQRVTLSIHQQETDEAVASSIDMTLAEARETFDREHSEPHREREAALLARVEAEEQDRKNLVSDLESVKAGIASNESKRRIAAEKRADKAALTFGVIAWVLSLGVVATGILAPLPSGVAVALTLVGGLLTVTGGAGAIITPLRRKVRRFFLNSELERAGLGAQPTEGQ